MIELSIPQAGEETKNVKDLVFSILSEKQPLSAIQLFNIIRQKYNVSLTYQAVNKAIMGLVQKYVLKKEGKYYRISQEWLADVKMTVDKLLTGNESERRMNKFNEDFAQKDYAIYSFATLLDLDTFWDDMLMHLADNMKDDEERIFLAHAHFGWWLLINLGKETRLFSHLRKKKVKCYNLFIGKYPLNVWAEKIYSELGVTFKVIEDKLIDDTITLNVIGDTVIQVQYPKKTLDRLREFYKKYRTTQDMSMKDITAIAHEPSDLKFIIFKNREIARSVREKYLRKF